MAMDRWMDGWIVVGWFLKFSSFNILCCFCCCFVPQSKKKRGSVFGMNFKIKMFVNDFIMSRMVHKKNEKNKKKLILKNKKCLHNSMSNLKKKNKVSRKS